MTAQAIMINPDKRFKAKVGDVSAAKLFSEREIQNAQQAVQNNEPAFTPRLVEGVVQLQALHGELVQADFKDAKKLAEFQRVVMDVKANAGLFNYELATDISWLLYQISERAATAPKPEHTIVMASLIKALARIFADKIKGNKDPVALNIVSEVTRYLA